MNNETMMLLAIFLGSTIFGAVLFGLFATVGSFWRNH